MKTLKFIFGVFSFLLDELTRFIKEKITKIRYKIELGGKDGFRVTGIWYYPGRFKSKQQIIELCLTLKPSKRICVYVRLKENDLYHHQFEILANEDGFELELLEADSQSYLYVKTIKKEQLEKVILFIEDHCDNPKKQGYQLEYF